MFSGRQMFAKAGSVMSLPFLFAIGLLLQSGVYSRAEEKTVLTFHEIESSCINLAHYDTKKTMLTVRFAEDSERFYCYTNVTREIWQKLIALNETGGVGNYFTTTVVLHRDKYPFEKITIKKFKTIPKKKKPEK